MSGQNHAEEHGLVGDNRHVDCQEIPILLEII